MRSMKHARFAVSSVSAKRIDEIGIAKAIRSALRVARHAAEIGLPDAIRAGIKTAESPAVAEGTAAVHP